MFYSFSRRIAIISFGILLVLASTAPGHAKRILFDDRLGTVVLDPGHGGKDQGALGPSGTLEKSITMELARLIAAELEPDFRVLLTRTDDYGLDPFKRTGAANHHEADVFVSLHTGASFLRNAEGLTIFYYQAPSSGSWKSETSNSHPGTAANRQPWQDLQLPHIKKSVQLAEAIQSQLLAQATFIESRLEGAPLIVLEGARMPAVLIEIGYLTNPVEEKALSDPVILTDFARGISRGIRAFIEK